MGQDDEAIAELIANGEDPADQPDPTRVVIGIFPSKGAPIKTLGDYLRVERDYVEPVQRHARLVGIAFGFALGWFLSGLLRRRA
jgi:hypothetical protein